MSNKGKFIGYSESILHPSHMEVSLMVGGLTFIWEEGSILPEYPIITPNKVESNITDQRGMTYKMIACDAA